jgi:hypothetical protein
MTIDAELENWRREWQTAGAVPLDLRKSVERQTRAMRLGVVGDVLVTVAMGGGATWWAVSSRQPEVTLLAAATWVFIVVAWAFALAVNAGRWEPSALDTNAFLDLSISRCRGRLATVKFGAALAVCEIAFGLGWAYRYSSQRQPVLAWLLFSSISIDLVWAFAAAIFALLVWYHRKKKAELNYLLQVRQESV